MSLPEKPSYGLSEGLDRPSCHLLVVVVGINDVGEGVDEPVGFIQFGFGRERVGVGIPWHGDTSYKEA